MALNKRLGGKIMQEKKQKIELIDIERLIEYVNKRAEALYGQEAGKKKK